MPLLCEEEFAKCWATLGQGYKMVQGKGVKLALVAACGVFLAGCAETTLAVHTARTVTGALDERPAAGRMGAYKVGDPYQINGVWYTPAENWSYSEEGMASWYGADFHGNSTANGEIYDMHDLTAAHRTLPMPSLVRVTNLENGRSLVVRINDRGPFAQNRIIDMSRRGAELLGFINQGTTRVRVEILREESLAMKAEAQAIGRGPAVQAAPRAPVMAESLDSPPPPPAQQPQAQQPQTQQQQLAASSPAPVRLVSSAQAATPSPSGAYIQAGAFSDHSNAERLRTQLASIAPVTVTPVTVQGQSLYRVRLGPAATDAEADRILQAVQAHGLPGARVVRD